MIIDKNFAVVAGYMKRAILDRRPEALAKAFAKMLWTYLTSWFRHFLHELEVKIDSVSSVEWERPSSIASFGYRIITNLARSTTHDDNHFQQA